MFAVPIQAKGEELSASGLQPFWSSWQGLGFYAPVSMLSKSYIRGCWDYCVRWFMYRVQHNALLKILWLWYSYCQFLDQVTRVNYYCFIIIIIIAITTGISNLLHWAFYLLCRSFSMYLPVVMAEPWSHPSDSVTVKLIFKVLLYHPRPSLLHHGLPCFTTRPLATMPIQEPPWSSAKLLATHQAEQPSRCKTTLMASLHS